MSRPLRPDLADEYTRFVSGQTFRLSELEFRVVEGRKRPGDLVLQWLTPSGWSTIRFDALGLIVDFLYENEHRLYPPSYGYKGGEKVREFLKHAIQAGFESAWRHLEWEKAQKQRTLFDLEDA